MSDHYEELGVGKDATPEQIKKAYRRRAAKTHPDKGGREEDFKRVHKAYAVLVDPERRAKYDKGEPDSQKSQSELDELEVIAIFDQMINGSRDPERIDLVEEAKRFIWQGQSDARTKIRQIEAKARKLRSTIKRLKRKDSEKNFVALALEARVAAFESQTKKAQSMIEQGNRMIAILDQYEFEVEQSEEYRGVVYTYTSS